MDNASIEQKKNLDLEIEKGALFRSHLQSQKDILQNDIKILNTDIVFLNEKVADKKRIAAEIPKLISQQRDLIRMNTSLTDSILSKEEVDEKELHRNEVASLRDEKHKLQKNVSELAESKTLIINKINYFNGQSEELKKKEEEIKQTLSTDISVLQIKKTELEGTISSVKKEIESIYKEKGVVEESIKIFKDYKANIKDGNNLVDHIVEHVSRINSQNVKEVDDFMIELKDKVAKIIFLSSSNIEKHNLILDEIPRLFVELQRKSLNREILNAHKH